MLFDTKVVLFDAGQVTDVVAAAAEVVVLSVVLTEEVVFKELVVEVVETAQRSLPVKTLLLYRALGAPLTTVREILPAEVEVKTSQVKRSVKEVLARTPGTVIVA